MNYLQPTFLLTCLTLLLVAMDSAIGGQSGMIIAFLFAGASMLKLFFTHSLREKRPARLQSLAALHS